MKKIVWLLLISAIATVSCIKEPILIDGVVSEKMRMDQTDNPAMNYMIRDELGKRRVQLFNVTVKDVTESTNIDYDFCVIVDVQTKKGLVECHIYSTDVKTVASLVKGKTKIDAEGDFGRFFSLLDDYYTRVEMLKSSIMIK
jgi:hypothetical protein